MDRERGGYGFVYGLGCVFTFMNWMTHGRLRMVRYPLFLGFLAYESLTSMMDIGRWLKMIFIQNDRVCFAASDLSDSNNFRETGWAPGTRRMNSERTSERFIRHLPPRYLIANSFTIIYSTNSILGVQMLLGRRPNDILRLESYLTESECPQRPSN